MSFTNRKTYLEKNSIKKITLAVDGPTVPSPGEVGLPVGGDGYTIGPFNVS